MKEVLIRQEEVRDYNVISSVIKDAFLEEEKSDHLEHELVNELRRSSAHVPELCLVAELDGEIVGHIFFSKILIKNGFEKHSSLALAPVSVLRHYHKQGIGSKLIYASHQKARELGFASIILLGHEDYYPRFGYRRASEFNIRLNFPAPDQNVMAIELLPNGLKDIEGVVLYPEAFYN